MRNIVLCCALMLLSVATVAQEANPDAEPAAAANPQVMLQTSKGNIVVELFATQAPKSVENFLQYVNDGFYNGTVFHRVIGNFMIQAGGFDAGMERKTPGDPIENEATNGLKNSRGTLAMARTPNPHSATSQFFINVVDNPSLDHWGTTSPRAWGYAVFGQVIEGMDVVDTIRMVPTANRPPHANVPVDPVVIESAAVVQPDSDDA